MSEVEFIEVLTADSFGTVAVELSAAYALIISDIFSAVYMLAFYYKSAEIHNLKFVNIFHEYFLTDGIKVMKSLSKDI